MKIINYPDDFRPFKGKALSSEEINSLMQDVRRDWENNPSGDYAAISTGNTQVEVQDYGYIKIWQLVATHEEWELA